jgi:hypothetical protein
MTGENVLPYDVNALRQRVSEDHAELFLGFTPWSEDASGWNRSIKEKLASAPGKSIRRTVWDSQDNRNGRILIDIIECSSAVNAIDALLEELAANQLARLLEGPPHLGIASFMHPEGVPPAVFFARGNLSIRVISFARHAVDVIPWAERLNKRLGEEPRVEQNRLLLESDRKSARTSEEVAVFYKLPWALGEDGFLKFLVSGGILVAREGRLLLKASKRGEAQVRAYALEPGREPYAGALNLSIE